MISNFPMVLPKVYAASPLSRPEVNPLPALVEAEPAVAPADANGPSVQLDSKEFKMLLDPRRFEHVEAGMNDLWGKVSAAADQSGVTVNKAPADEVRKQDIIFLDTEDHALNHNGYILRYRDVEGAPSKDNLTLKYRDHDPIKVSQANVESAAGVKGKAKFELDETFQNVETSVYSKSQKVKLAELPKPKLKNFGKIFPALDGLGLDPSIKLKNVHAGAIVEERHLLGNVQVGEHDVAPAYLTLWYDEDSPEPAVAEFSFATAAPPDSGLDRTSEKLMRTLKNDATEWLSSGSTKTNFAYSE